MSMINLDSYHTNPIWHWKYRKVLVMSFPLTRLIRHARNCKWCVVSWDFRRGMTVQLSLICPVGAAVFDMEDLP